MWPFGRRCEKPCDEQVVDKIVLPSAQEQLHAAGQSFGDIRGNGVLGLFRKTVVLTIRCTACGKVRTIKEMS